MTVCGSLEESVSLGELRKVSSSQEQMGLSVAFINEDYNKENKPAALSVHSLYNPASRELVLPVNLVIGEQPLCAVESAINWQPQALSIFNDNLKVY